MVVEMAWAEEEMALAGEEMKPGEVVAVVAMGQREEVMASQWVTLACQHNRSKRHHHCIPPPMSCTSDLLICTRILGPFR